MNCPYIAFLPHRAVLAVRGEDRVPFLQGLVSNDVALAAPGVAVWAGLLTPQGKYWADFFIVGATDHLLLDVEASRAAEIAQRLTRFRLRSRVTIEAIDQPVHAAWGAAPPDAAGMVVADSRLPDAGWRILGPASDNADKASWDAHRLALGLPDGTRDMAVDRTLLLEAGFDELHGISWTKGCYMGQELTARTRYRGLLKRRLVPVLVDGPAPEPGTPIRQQEREIGVMRSAQGGHGLAEWRLDALNAPAECASVRLTAQVPDWMRLPPRP